MIGFAHNFTRHCIAFAASLRQSQPQSHRLEAIAPDTEPISLHCDDVPRPPPPEQSPANADAMPDAHPQVPLPSFAVSLSREGPLATSDGLSTIQARPRGRGKRIKYLAHKLQSPFVEEHRFPPLQEAVTNVWMYPMIEGLRCKEKLVDFGECYATRHELAGLGPQRRVSDLVFLPILKRSHWFLIVLNMLEKRVEVLDSLANEWPDHYRAVLTKLTNFFSAVFGELKPGCDKRVQEWPIHPVSVPCQSSAIDCSVFLMKFMEYWDEHRLSTGFGQVLRICFTSSDAYAFGRFIQQ